MQIEINRAVSIPLHEIDFRFSRSGGPGGQNVNKVESRVELLFNVADSPSLSASQRALVAERLAARIDVQGVLHVVVDSSRSQWENRVRALQRFGEIMRKALVRRAPRVRTGPTRAAREKRLQAKRKRGEVKRRRGGVDDGR
jgi:ribosome-associated protein